MESNDLRVVRADSMDLFKKSVALQKSVYCNERRYEDPNDHMDPYAFDDYDRERQTRRILIMGKDDIPLATARVIIPGSLKLPAFSLQPQIEESLSDKMPVVECSAFCASRSACKEAGVSQKTRRKILLMLIDSLCGLAEEIGLDHSVMTLEKVLYVYLQRCGFKLKAEGQPVYYFGWRITCWGSREDMVFGVKNASLSKTN